jgi:outer membrane protein TolC
MKGLQSARQVAPVFAVSLSLAAWASFSPDGGMEPVVSQVRLELGQDAVKISSVADELRVNERLAGILKKPLTADSAVQIALMNNRGLQAEYNVLGVSEANYVEAFLPPVVPFVSVERVLDEWELSVERGLAIGLIELATWPKRRSIASTDFAAARARAVEATFRTAADTRRAYLRAVGARQRVRYLERARQTASLVAELTTKLGETGAATKAAQARASAFYAEVAAELARARLDADRMREALTRQLGLWGPQIEYSIPSGLPKLPKIKSVEAAETQAVQKRVDLVAARLELDSKAKELGLENATSYISLLELTGTGTTERTREDGRSQTDDTQSLELHLIIPIWDLGETKRRRAAQTYMESVNRMVELAVNIRSEAREAYRSYRATHDIAVQYQSRVIPLRDIIDEEALLEYNGMLIDITDLLEIERESINSNIAAIDARLEFFIAETDLKASIIGGVGGDSGAGSRATGQAVAADAAGH